MRILRDEVKVQVLIDIAKEWERGRENKNSNSCRDTEERDEDAFGSIGEWFCLVVHQTLGAAETHQFAYIRLKKSCARESSLSHLGSNCSNLAARQREINKNGGRLRPPLRKFNRYLF